MCTFAGHEKKMPDRKQRHCCNSIKDNTIAENISQEKKDERCSTSNTIQALLHTLLHIIILYTKKN